MFFENMSRNFRSNSNLTRITGIVHEDLCAICRSIPLTMRKISNKRWR